MNEKRFIELVNLYIDHEIAPHELEELENEVAHHAQRRKVYHEYCRLQQASQTACQEFRTSLVRTVDLRKYHILARESRSRSRIGIFYSAGALAAACLAVFAATSVFTSQNIVEAETGGILAEAETAAIVEVFHSAQIDVRAVRTPVASTTPTLREFSTYRISRGNELLSSMRSSARGGFQFSVFPATSSWPEDYRTSASGRVFRSNPSIEAPAALSSVQFQR